MTGTGATGSGDGDGDGMGTGGTGGGEECVPVADRCDCVVAADGVNTLIDSFEDGDTRINVIDSRDGEWPLGTLAVEENALHLFGDPTTLNPPEGEPDDWATFGVPLGQCYNAASYTGIQFRIRGTAGDSIRFSISTPPTTEVAAGGSCPDGDLGCYNHFGSTIVLTSDWETKTLTWDQLQQAANWGTKAPNGYAKEQNIMAINFAPFEDTKGYDFWIDDVQFTSDQAGSCGDVISESQFNSLFPSRNPFYTYAGFVEAAEQFPAFCGEGTEDDRKRDVAALFAHTIQETGGNVSDPTSGLVHIEEINKSDYCDAGRTEFQLCAQHGRPPRGESPRES